MRGLYIPKLGDVLKLARPWTFTVYNEYRNNALLNLTEGATSAKNAGLHYGSYGQPVGTHTFPIGTLLTVDRIYIRQGGETYNSVTFRARHYTRPAAKKEKVVRFWVKLDDANTISFV